MIEFAWLLDAIGVQGGSVEIGGGMRRRAWGGCRGRELGKRAGLGRGWPCFVRVFGRCGQLPVIPRWLLFSFFLQCM